MSTVKKNRAKVTTNASVEEKDVVVAVEATTDVVVEDASDASDTTIVVAAQTASPKGRLTRFLESLGLVR